MGKAKLVTQPSSNPTANVIADNLGRTGYDDCHLAYAYVTRSGCRAFENSLCPEGKARWLACRKRWLVSLDYLRSEPEALRHLSSVQNSELRVPNGKYVLENAGRPAKPFHPKAILLSSKSKQAVVIGSGNFSKSGLTLGHELAISIRSKGKDDAAALVRGDMLTWFNSIWALADPLSDVIDEYESLYQSPESLFYPTVTDDDFVNVQNLPTALGSIDILRLRRARHFWIETNKVSQNRGKKKPGNQIMLKKMSRVYFGVLPRDVPTDTALRTVDIQIGDNDPIARVISYSNNAMDKITLPIPEENGVKMYDYKALVFTRLGNGNFKLKVLSKAHIKSLQRRSSQISASYQMGSAGRRWGVF